MKRAAVAPVFLGAVNLLSLVTLVTWGEGGWISDTADLAFFSQRQKHWKKKHENMRNLRKYIGKTMKSSEIACRSGARARERGAAGCGRARGARQGR